MSVKISIVIIMQPSLMNADEAVLKTVKSVSKHMKKGADNVQYVIASVCAEKETGSSVFSTIREKAALKNIIYTDDKDINSVLTGDVVFVLRQGAWIKAGNVSSAAEELHSTSCIIGEPKRDGKDKLPCSGYISIHAKFSALGGIPENIVLNRDEDVDFGGFVRGGIDAREQLILALLKSEGDYYLHGFEIACDKTNDELIVPDAEGVIRRLISASKESLGYVSEFIQNYVLKILALKMDEYAHIDGLTEILADISDEILFVSSYLDIHQTVYLLSKKYMTDVRDEIYVTDSGKFSFRGIELNNVNAAIHIKVSISSVRDNKLILEGMTDLPYYLDRHYSLHASGSTCGDVPVEIMPLTINDQLGFDGEVIFRGQQYKVEFPLEGDGIYMLYLQDEQGKKIVLTPAMGAFSRLNSRLPMCYFRESGYLVHYESGEFHVSKYSKKLHRKYEKRYLGELLSEGRFTIVLYRILYYIDKMFQRKPVWIVMDRPHLAKDNGEHMFRYLQNTDAAKKNDIYFVLKKSSRDYERLKKVGKVLVHNSLKHRLKYLESRFLIAAAANNLTVNAFGKSGVYYHDLYSFNFVYLRHGVSHNDQSDWLHHLKKNMRVLVATCKPEYDGILKGGYGYTEREVKLTGLARYDNLYNDKKKIIAILPTWRQNLEGELLYRSSKRGYIPGFKDSDYFKFYNGLINNEKLLSAMKENGYTGVFYLHPVFEAQFKDFSGNDIIKVGNGVAYYQQVFKESALMVTDFSSVAFDFAYLKKPVIYSQFDEDTFYKYHTWGKGYFTYRKDGFGPITTSLEETVDTLIEYIETGCEMKPEYVEKVDNFFAYTDRNNCKRIYDAILQADSEKH